MTTLWILSANRSYAKIFEVTGKGRQIKEIAHIENPDGRKKAGELVSDKPGRTFDRVGGGRHALSQEVGVKEKELQAFVHKLYSHLEEGRQKNAYEELAIVAPAHVLGVLNQELSAAVKKLVVKEVHKDLPEQIGEGERIDLLCNYLDLWNRTDNRQVNTP